MNAHVDAAAFAAFAALMPATHVVTTTNGDHEDRQVQGRVETAVLDGDAVAGDWLFAFGGDTFAVEEEGGEIADLAAFFSRCPVSAMCRAWMRAATGADRDALGAVLETLRGDEGAGEAMLLVGAAGLRGTLVAVS